MLSSGGGASAVWFESEAHCNGDFVKSEWWRIPLYLLCSVAVLGQYRMPVDQYWRGLVVMLVAYELQYSIFNGMAEDYTFDHLDTAASNIAGAAGGVLAACALSWLINTCRDFYSARLLQKDEEQSKIGYFIYQLMRCSVKLFSCLRVGRRSDILKLEMEQVLAKQKDELNDPGHPRSRIDLSLEKENLFLETVVGSQGKRHV